MIIKKLTELKTSRKLTNQQISDLSGVPLSTVTRIFGGQTESPNLQTIADIVKALDGSVDELLGLRYEEKKGAPVNTDLIELYKEIIRNKDEHIRSKDEIIRGKDKTVKMMGFALIGIVGVLLLILIIVIFNGGLGFMRY